MEDVVTFRAIIPLNNNLSMNNVTFIGDIAAFINVSSNLRCFRIVGVARECSRGVKGGLSHLIGVLNTVESGNLLLLNSSNLNNLWQSFDYLTDTLLPGMNVRVDFTSGMSWSFRSWENEEDPSPGVFSLEVEEDDNYIYEKLIVKIKKGSEIYWIGDELSNFTFQSYNRQSNTIRKQGYLTWQGEYTSRLARGIRACR
ncbi:Receptor-like serine/threonine-protein kinase SD1-7 [Senna tora]|uniref:Receptor-like serine/threonine-protein kinase SD1-7 n=1 Tax=Senna tora TaxID=362788 RepID=A0A834T4X7_9FABA|nr:Receptor-like serine/threonine-protein kinase SD1-7 [Senna tora]